MPRRRKGRTEGVGFIWDVVKRGDKAGVEACLADGQDVNDADWNGETILMRAAWEGHFDIVKLLVAHGADVNAVDADGESAVINAARRKLRDMALWLAEHGADVTRPNRHGKSAVDLSQTRRDKSHGRALLAAFGSGPHWRRRGRLVAWRVAVAEA